MSKKYYLTTPLYYVNSPLTVGGAYTTIAADVIARYRRRRGEEVFFLTGSDEHGQKIKQAADAQGISPRELADGVVGTFLELWRLLDVTQDDFIRTTEPRHERVVAGVFQKLLGQGDIYWGKYEGWYCTPCETFWLPSQVVEGNCPQCHRAVEKLKEENFFFRLSRYQGALEKHFQDHPDFVQPPNRYREMLNRLKEGLNDVSISRSVKWGIPVPGREDQVIWVWFDALLNYISAAGYGAEPERFARTWPADLHLMAKDILWFHTLLWPAILLALELPLPERVYAHGWWTMGGEKISKSKEGKVLARDLVEEFGADALRYFLLREIPLGLDGDFSVEALAARYRSDLAHDLGNLLQRSLNMIKKFRSGRWPRRSPPEGGDSLFQGVQAIWSSYHREMEDLRFSQVLESIWELVRRGNRYVEENKPWLLYKRPGEERKLDGVLFNLAWLMLELASLLQPFLPSTCQKICRQIYPGLPEPLSFSEAAELPFDRVGGGQPIGEIEPLFPLPEPG